MIIVLAVCTDFQKEDLKYYIYPFLNLFLISEVSKIFMLPM